MIHISEAADAVIERLAAQIGAKPNAANVVPFPVTSEMRIRIALRRMRERDGA